MKDMTKKSINNFLLTNDLNIDLEDLKLIANFVLEGDYADSTGLAMISDIKDFIRWYVKINKEKFNFQRVTTRDIVDYKNHCIEESNHAANTVNRKLATLRIFFKYLRTEGRIEKNPSDVVKNVARQPLAPRGLDRQQLRALLKEVDIRGKLRDILIVEMLSGAGFRVSEIANLKIEDVSIREKSGYAIVKYGKGNKTRVVPLNNRIRTLLKEYIGDRPQSENIFIGQRGALTTIAFNKILELYADKVRLTCSPHRLRHTFSYNYLEKNPGDIIGLAQILGHSNINTTAIYTQNRIEDLQEKVEKMD